MHDIIHDFAQFLTKNECFIVESINDLRKLEPSLKNARYLTWLDNGKSSSPVSICAVQKLRSFRCEKFIPPHVLVTLKCVRELSLVHCELPPEIGNLIHLRYLDLTGNPLIKLPKSMCKLYHLQTLVLERCSNLSELPEEIDKLTNLRYIFVNDGVSFPQGVEKLTCLRTLVHFRASSGGSKLGYLKNLKQLEILFIVIDDLNEESDVIEASKAELGNKNGLQILGLKLRGDVSIDVMEALEPPSYMSVLSVDGYVSLNFPRWFVTSLHNLKILKIQNCSSLPPLGTLQSLEGLYISSITKMEILNYEFLGITVEQLDGGRAVAFPKLKKLEFYRCPRWTKWEDIGDEEEENVLDSIDIMPCLRELNIIYCRNLESLPHHLLRRMPLEHLNIFWSSIIIKQYESKGGYEFLRPTCKVTLDSF